MAEVIGTVACCTQLAGQIIASLQTIISFYHQIKNAPDHISSLLNYLDSTSKVFKQLSEDDEGDEITLSSLRVAKEILGDLEELLGKLNSEIKNNGWKGKMKVGSMKIVGKEALIKEMIERLERAKSSLNGALLHNIMTTQRQHTSKLELQTSILTSMANADVQIIMNRDQSADKAAWEKLESFSEVPSVKFVTDTETSRIRAVTSFKDDIRSTSFRRKKKVVIERRWYWIGWHLTKRTHYKATEDVGGIWPDDVEIETKWLPATWTYLPASWKKKEMVCGHWKKSFNPISVVPDGSPLFKACSRGNLGHMIELFDSGQGSIYDTLPVGTTLLHIAAQNAHADLCRWLIEKGASADAVEITFGGRTPLHRAVTNGNNTKTSCDTMRVLVEYGQCDVMAGTPRYDPTWRGITPFEWYSACPEGFRYLLNQDHSFIDFTEKEIVEYLVLDTLLAPSPKQIKLARLALFSIRGPGFQNAVVMKYFKSKATLLHWAVYCLSDISCGLPADRKSCTGHITALLSEILAAGADIHAVDEQGTTPFSYLIGYSYRNRKHFRLTLFSWLNVVQSAGHDLSKYIHKEIKICPLIFTIREDSPSNQAFCDPDHMETRWQLAYQSIKRSMDLETSDASGNLILRFSQEPLWSKKEQDDFFRPRMPGSWKPDAEAQTNWEYVWKYYQIRSLDGCSFCLGPLKNGVREFGLYGDEACESRQDCGDEKCCPFLDDDSCEDAEENDEDFRTV